ncbi:MAG: hypothetical protein ACQES9_11405 [Myxococcota bacterium]
MFKFSVIILVFSFSVLNSSCKKEENSASKTKELPTCKDLHEKLFQCGGKKNRQDLIDSYGDLENFNKRCKKLEANKQVDNLIKCTVFSCDKFKKCLSGNLEGAIKLSNIKEKILQNKTEEPRCRKVWKMINKCSKPKFKQKIKNYFGDKKRFVNRCSKYKNRKSIKNLLSCSTDNCREFKSCSKRKGSLKAILLLSYAKENIEKAKKKRKQRKEIKKKLKEKIKKVKNGK